MADSIDLDAEAERFERAYGAVWFAFHHGGGDDGLGQLERQILHHVGDGASPSEIADHLGLARSTTTMVLKRLEQKGLVSKTRSEADERRVDVARTADGDSLVEDSSLLRRSDLVAALASLPEPVRTGLIAALEQLVAGRDG